LGDDIVEIAKGVSLSRIYVDTFSAPMMAFAPPPTSRAPHPGPWVAVSGGFTFEARTQINLAELAIFDGLAPRFAIWLVAALLRLQITTPLRVAALCNTPFAPPENEEKKPHAIAFENAPNQLGVFTSMCIVAAEEEVSWLRDMLPSAVRLYHDERFFRAFSVYDQAQWSPTKEMGTVLVWTAIEILLGISSEREKTKAICKRLSEFVGVDRADRDRAYQVVQHLYYERGRAIHSGHLITDEDTAQSFRLACVAFRRVVIDGLLPDSSSTQDD
jgi:hypothetical protein